MYYRLETDIMELTAFVEQQSGPPIYKMREGKTWDAGAEGTAFAFQYEDWQDPPLLDFVDGDCLMSRGFIERLQSAGVDNLQVFEATLTNKDSGAVNEDFRVVNIVGLARAAQAEGSESLPLGGKVVFSKLTLDPAKTEGRLMFRLHESPGAVIIHENVANAIEEGDFRGIKLTKVGG